jgi:hypothetical protein
VRPAQALAGASAQARVEMPGFRARSGTAGAATSAAVTGGVETSAAVSGDAAAPATVSADSAPVQDPVVPLPAPPAPVPPPAPASPTSASCGSSASGAGSHHHDGLVPVILGSEVAPVSPQVCTRVDTAAAGAVTGGAADPGSRPD